MNQIWDESVGFIRRESALLIPLALATIYVSDVAAALVPSAASTPATPSEPDPVVMFTILATTIWSIVGQLSIASLVLNPGQSVGEALAHGLSRLGKVILIALLLGLVASVAILPIAAAAVASGANPANPESLRAIPGWISIAMLIALGGMIWLGIRLALMNALIVDRNPGVIAALKGGFALTQGIAARLFMVVLLYAIMLIILGSAVRFVAGSLFALFGAALDSPFVGTVLTALVSSVVSTAMTLLAAVFLATLYRRVAGGS